MSDKNNVCCQNSVRIILSLAANWDIPLRQCHAEEHIHIHTHIYTHTYKHTHTHTHTCIKRETFRLSIWRYLTESRKSDALNYDFIINQLTVKCADKSKEIFHRHTHTHSHIHISVHNLYIYRYDIIFITIGN